MIYGYARVSSKEQNLDRQIVEIEKENPNKIYQEKQSGKDFETRKVYQSLKKKLKPGDLLIILSIDRLGRNYEQILNEWKDLTNKGCDIQVLDMPILNTRSGIKGLDGKFISDLVLQILAYVSQKEREKIKERQAEGIRIAREKGVKFGRKNIVIDNEMFKQDMQVLTNKEMIKKYNVSNGTFFRFKKELCPELMKQQCAKNNTVQKKKTYYVAYLYDGKIYKEKTITELSKRLFVSHSTLSHLYYGHKVPCLDQVVKKVEKVEE